MRWVVNSLTTLRCLGKFCPRGREQRYSTALLLLQAADLCPRLVVVDHVAAVADEAAGRLGSALPRRRQPVDWEHVRLGLAAIALRLRLGFG